VDGSILRRDVPSIFDQAGVRKIAFCIDYEEPVCFERLATKRFNL
jgi:hypothetical protein